MAKGPLHIPSLDGLRAISFAIVFVSHAGLGHLVPGGFGVTVFFFLSGFLITTLMRLEHEKTGTVSLSKFYMRRVRRILPTYYVVLAGATAIALLGLTDGRFELPGLMAQLFHYANYWVVLHGYEQFPPGTGVYWSLAVEQHFYLFFPLVFLLLRRTGIAPRAQALALLFGCLAILAWRFVLVYGLGSSVYRTSLATDTRFDSLLFGCALALYHNPALGPVPLSDRVWKYVLFPIALLGLAVSFLVRDHGFRETLRYTVQGVCLVPVFVCAVRFPDWAIIKPLNSKPLALIGVLSYSLYLTHQVALRMVGHWFGAALGVLGTGMVSAVVSFLASLLVYSTVEKRGRSVRRPQPVPSPQSAA